jgi:hypothetical protein
MDAYAARKLTDQIKRDVNALWSNIVAAYLGRADIALGYGSWDEYTIVEFKSLRGLRMPREERTEVVHSLRHAGLPVRAIASATGLGVGTVHREIAADQTEPAVPNGTPDEPIKAEVVDEDPIAAVIGIDGKRHPAHKRREVSVGDDNGQLVQLGPPHSCGGRCENCLAKEQRRFGKSVAEINRALADLALSVNSGNFALIKDSLAAEQHTRRIEGWIDTLKGVLDAFHQPSRPAVKSN